jgi:hypothetical protein
MSESPRGARIVAGKGCAHFVEKASVDFKDDFEVSREERAEEIDRPLL